MISNLAYKQCSSAWSAVRVHPRERKVVSLAADGDLAVLWEISSEDLRKKEEIGSGADQTMRYCDVAFAPRQDLVALVGLNRPIELRRSDDLELIIELSGDQAKEQSENGYSAVTFSGDGKWLFATSVEEGRTEVFEVSEGRQVDAYWERALNTDFAVHPAGRVIANVMYSHAEYLVRFVAYDGEFRGYAIEIESLMEIGGICFSPDGTSLALAGGIPPLDVEVYDFPECTLRFAKMVQPGADLSPPFILEGGFPWTDCCAFSPDSRLLLCPYPGGEIGVLNTRSGEELSKVEAHNGPATSIDAQYTTGIYVSAALDGTIILWRLQSDYTHMKDAEVSTIDRFEQSIGKVSRFPKWNDFSRIEPE